MLKSNVNPIKKAISQILLVKTIDFAVSVTCTLSLVEFFNGMEWMVQHGSS